MNLRFLTTCVDESQLPISQPGSNPYASPAFPDSYKSDWSLVKRCLFWFSMLVVAMLLPLSFSLWSEYRSIGRTGVTSPFQQVSEFLTGWN